jgi:hypothetical protein
VTTLEAARRTRQGRQDLIEQQRRHQEAGSRYDDMVMTLGEWCDSNSFSVATGRRILKSGNGPTFVQLSERRIGITVRANREWLASRAKTNKTSAA